LVNIFIDKLDIFQYIKEELSKIKGIKLYSTFKIIEYVIILSNKFLYDIDLQILKIIKARKLKYKIMSLLILHLFLFANIYIIHLFYYCNYLIIYDDNKYLIPIYLKVNYIEFKQSNKSFKSIHNFLSSDINDRFLNYLVLFFVIIDGFTEKKITYNINNVYLKRILFCFIAEFISDYLKGIIIFKTNNLNPKDIKKFLNEEIKFYNQISSKEIEYEEYKFLKNTKHIKNTNNISEENIISIILNINIFSYSIIFFYFIIVKKNICIEKKCCILIFLICLRILTKRLINFINNNNNISSIKKKEE
jgi:hypothetical protein